MNKHNIWSDENLIKVLSSGGVAVMPTDTLYGIVGSANNENTVNRIYDIRKRRPTKPCIILIGDMDDLGKFSIILTEEQKVALKIYWPGPYSFVLDCKDENFKYLHRGINTLAFRIPAIKPLQDLLVKVGPLIAPSANTEALPPSANIDDAKKYFGSGVDLYIDGGEIEGKPSRVIKLHKDGSVSILRE